MGKQPLNDWIKQENPRNGKNILVKVRTDSGNDKKDIIITFLPEYTDVTNMVSSHCLLSM